MKRFPLIFFFLLISAFVFSQTDSSATRPLTDTQPKLKGKKDSMQRTGLTSPQVKVVQPSAQQATDSTLFDSLNLAGPLQDSTAVDTINKKVAIVALKKYTGIDSAYARFLNHPFLPMNRKAVFQIVNVRQPRSKDNLFYLVAGLVFFLAFIKLVFARYYANIFRLFFQPSFRQKQTREQLMQSSLPSLLLNLFFIFSAGIYGALLVQHYDLLTINFWRVLLYTTASLLILYLGKYVFITFSGWVFNAKEAANTYIFAVYLINKILGVLLLPFIFIIAFADAQIITSAVIISYLIVGLLFLYRYSISFSPVRKEMKVSSFHFGLYVVAFEILPLLFICKLLILYMAGTL